MSKLSQYNGKEWVEIKGAKGDKPVAGVDFPLPKDGAVGPKGITGLDGSPDTPDEIIEKINQAKKKIEIAQIKGLRAILESLERSTNYPVGTLGGGSTGAGLTELTATGAVNGVNTTFTFDRKPKYIVSDSAWYKENNGWTYSGTTATMTIPPRDSIYGIISL